MESNEYNTIIRIEKGNELIKLISSRGTIDILSLFCCSIQKYRFLEINNLLQHLGTKTLSARLKGLEKAGVLKRDYYNEIPPRVEYSITEKGVSLIKAAKPLITWIAEGEN